MNSEGSADEKRGRKGRRGTGATANLKALVCVLKMILGTVTKCNSDTLWTVKAVKARHVLQAA